jgi:K+-transporting ATPase ATPase C chain
MLTHLRHAIVWLALITVLTGGVYPLVVHAIAQIAFSQRANGSLIERDGKIVGSHLVGQQFASPRYFWGRLSATSAFPYDAAASSGSNFGPTNPALIDAARARIESLRNADSADAPPIPVDLATSSASGLDPHVSPAAALRQVARVARERGLAPELVRELVLERVEPRTFGILGEPRVNVLELNLALDALR